MRALPWGTRGADRRGPPKGIAMTSRPDRCPSTARAPRPSRPSSRGIVLASAVACVLALAGPAQALTDEEVFRSFRFNTPPPGARALGMGGAFIGLADDATATFTNPAGLGYLMRP